MESRTQRLLLVFITVSMLLLLTTGLSFAKGGPISLLAPQAPIGSGFTYQGQLTNGGVPADGIFDLQFDLYDSVTDGDLISSLVREDVLITNGLFTVSLDFGSGVFDGQARWLGISVRSGTENGAFTSLTPRQPLTAAPYAQYALEAGIVSWENVSGNPIPENCASGETMIWNAATTSWECAVNTEGITYNAGFGLNLDNTTFNVLTNTVQTRVTGTCAAGSMVRAVNADGTVICETDNNSTYNAGFGMYLDNTTFNVLTDTVQTRITGTCTIGSMVRSINADGTVLCETDNNTTYNAGFGMGLDDTTFNVLTNTMQVRVTGTCAPGSMVRSINADGTVDCEANTDTNYNAGFGLELNGTTFNVQTDTVQTRVTGTCAIGSTIQVIHADGSVECEPHDTRPAFSNVVVDSSGNIGRVSSITIGVDGLPIISYFDETNGDLKAAHCNNLDCTNTTVNIVDSAGNVGMFSSIAIGADGLPIISYYDGSAAGALKVAHCIDAVCTEATITVPDNTMLVNGSTSLAIGADGLPVIGYDHSPGLAVAHCNDITCSSASINEIDTTMNRAMDISIAIGSDGLPVMSYYDWNNGYLKVAHCNNNACTIASVITVDNRPWVGENSSITIGSDGLPIISYLSIYNDLGIAHCNNMACSSFTINSIDTAGNVGYLSSISIGADGLPVISYYDSSNMYLKVAHCVNVACTSATTTRVSMVNMANNSETSTTITIGVDGLPVISYYDALNQDLKVTHCSNPFCVPYWRRR